MRELKGTVSHSAVVHEAQGFRAAMIRSIVTGIAALSNPGFPHRVFTTTSEAAAWIKEGCQQLDLRSVEETVLAVRAAVLSGRRVGRVGSIADGTRGP